MELINQSFIGEILKERENQVHKGLCGNVLVVAGSKGMIGAAILTAKGALQSGAGLVRVSVEEEFFPILQSALPEAICIDRKSGLNQLDSYDAIACGPGIGLESKNTSLIEAILDTEKPKIILDADGLAFLKLMGKEAVKKTLAVKKQNLVITPHPGEAANLLGRETKEINAERDRFAIQLSKDYGAISVLKGWESIVTDLSYRQYKNTSGNPGMATAGSGDVLTGIIGSFAGQGYTALESTILGVYIHGLAGDMAREFSGEHGLIASDIASMAGRAIKKVLTKKKEMENG